MSALGREDLRVLAADRRFLRALPRLSTHFLWVSELGEQRAQRAGALKRAVRHLKKGGVLLHFPAGQIEPDADFEPDQALWLKPWQPGTAALVAACARVDGRVLVAGVRGCALAARQTLLLNRLAERRGITTLSPLLQMICSLTDVRTRVCCRDAGRARVLSQLSPVEQQARLRAALLHSLILESSPNRVVLQAPG